MVDYTKAIWKKRAIDVTDFEYPYDKGVMALLLQSVFGITMDIEGDLYQFNKWGDVRKVSNLKGLLRNYFSFLYHRAKIENSRFMMVYFNLYFYNSHKVVLDQPEYQKFIPWSDGSLSSFSDLLEQLSDCCDRFRSITVGCDCFSHQRWVCSCREVFSWTP